MYFSLSVVIILFLDMSPIVYWPVFNNNHISMNFFIKDIQFATL